MPHPKKIVLHCRNGYEPRIDTLVEEFIQDGVIFVGVVGADCAKVEDIIDDAIGHRVCVVTHLVSALCFVVKTFPVPLAESIGKA